MTPLAPLTMQELKLSQTLDGANMSPYHTTGEFATSLVFLRSCRIMYTCFAEHKVLLNLSQICACPTNMSTSQVCTTSSVMVLTYARLSAASSILQKNPFTIHNYYLYFMSDKLKDIYIQDSRHNRLT